MGSGVLIFRAGYAGIGKNQKINGKNGGWVGGSETILQEDGFFNFSKITDDPLLSILRLPGVDPFLFLSFLFVFAEKETLLFLFPPAPLL